MQVLYNGQTDLTQLCDGPDNDGIQQLFMQSNRPQRKSLIQSYSLHEGNTLTNLKYSSLISNCGENWLQKSRDGHIGSVTGQFPTSNSAHGSRYRRRTRWSRNRHRRSLHVDPASARASEPGQCGHSSPVRYLPPRAVGPLDPDALAARLDECSIQQPAVDASCLRGGSQGQASSVTEPQEATRHNFDQKRAQSASQVTCAHGSNVEVDSSTGLPLLPGYRRNTVHTGEGRGSRQCGKVDYKPAKGVNCIVSAPVNAFVEASRRDEVKA
jgi:hypothetical protein